MRVLIVVFIFFLFSCGQEETIVYSSVNFDLIKLSDGVYAAIHKVGGKAICNVGVIDNGDETLVFDTFLSPAVAEELLEVIKDLGLSPVKYVINSHFHNDHIRGNQVFSNAVKIISTSRTAELIEELEPAQLEYEKEFAPERYAHYDSLYHSFTGDTTSRKYIQILMWRPYYETLAESHKEVKTRLPDHMVNTFTEYNGSERKAILIPRGKGHSESDLILYLPDDKILFSGDLIFNQCHPYMGHGSLSGLKEWLKFLITLDIETVVPGHGPVGPKSIIAEMSDYVVALESLTKDLPGMGLSSDALDSIQIPDAYKAWWFDRFYPSNIRFTYTELKR